MHIRTRKNKSGSVSVFLEVSKRIKGRQKPKSIMIKSFGSASDENRIQELINAATKYKDGVSSTTAGQKQNYMICSDEINSCQIYKIGFKHFYGEIFDRHFSNMSIVKGFDYKTLEQLSVLRIAAPASKLKTSRCARLYGVSEININKIYRFMDVLDDEKIEKIKEYVYENTKKLIEGAELDVLFYDLTTVYFESNETSELKEFGFSKDGKHQHVQISLALIVTHYGLPVGYEIFKGNISEGKTLLGVLLELRNKYKINTVSVVTDSAMMANDRLTELRKHGFNYVIAARIRNLSKKMTEVVLDDANYKQLDDDKKSKTIALKDHSLITCYSKRRHKKDVYDRERSIKKIEKYLGKSTKNRLSGALKRSYVKLTSDSTILLDQDKLEESKKLDGYFGFYTNIKDPDTSAIISHYKGLWQIEQTFRITKHNLAIRPIYHWKDRRIKAHFAICFLALALIRTAEHLLKKLQIHLPIEQLHTLLGDMQIVKIIHSRQVIHIMSDISEEVKNAFKSLGIGIPKRVGHRL